MGCDLQAAQFVLKDLAKFHAVPLALKILKPDLFEHKLKKYMSFSSNGDDQHFENIDQCLWDIFEENDDCKPRLDLYKKAYDIKMKKELNFREPFATLSHKDMWVNNFMVKIENGKVVKNCFVDFQDYTYDSPVKDLLFLLFSSVQVEVLKQHLDQLIRLYHEEFIKTLTELSCPANDFSHENFIQELNHFAAYEIYHILDFSVYVVFGKKGHQISGNDFPFLNKEDVPGFVRERLCWVFQEFIRRHWL